MCRVDDAIRELHRGPLELFPKSADRSLRARPRAQTDRSMHHGGHQLTARRTTADTG